MENDVLTSDIRGHRTLATVAFTDCVGFSARMSVDEDHTLDLIRRDLQFMKQVCEKFDGRVLKSTGDGLLMYFVSAVKAVECAVEIQTALVAKAAELPPEDALEHRIGIHLADMFITNTDVMGNGVNIAARLQTEADPGGICISQTVYDVVKAGLHLETVYLGPRELKNIHEVVPAYKILLSPSSQATSSTALVVRNLEQSKNRLRIKKLIFYVCKNQWESDPAKLESLHLDRLIQDLLTLAPTPDRIKFCLDTAVKTLSKPGEYALVANLILKEVSRLCASEPARPAASHQFEQEDSQTVVEVRRPPQNEPDLLYEQVVFDLEQTGNLLRLKKLALYVCRRHWENDPTRLDEVPLKTLVAELHHLAPTLERLGAIVDSFVQTLSKKAEYSLIANLLLVKLQPLYGANGASSTASQDPLAHPETQPTDNELGQTPQQARYASVVRQLEREPDLLRIKKLLLYVCRRQWESDLAKLTALDLRSLVEELHQLVPTSERLGSLLTAVVKTLSKQAEYSAIAQIMLQRLSSLYSDAPATPSPEASTHAVTNLLPQSQRPQPANPNPPSPSLPNSQPASTPAAPNSGSASANQPTNAQPAIDQSQSALTLLDYRLGIMKNTNPLRAKILLFSALHEDFNFGNQDWLNLKLHELDGLLRHLLRVCKTYTDMEALLYSTARRLKDPEETVQTADTVIKCLRSFYLNGAVLAEIDRSSDNTEINLDAFEETTFEFSNAATEEEHTCQVLPPASDATLMTTAEPLGLALFPRQNKPPLSSPPSLTSSDAAETDDNTNFYPPST